MAAPRFHRLAIAEIRAETAHAITLRFDIPDDLRGAYRFAPGQYVTLRAEIDGEEVRRSYSICSTPDAATLTVAIKRVARGRFSNFAHDALKAGDALDVMTPEGRFTLPPGGWPRRVAIFAAGSGITPIMSILRAHLAGEPESRFTLFYGNRARADIMFLEALEDLKDRWLTRFQLFHVLSREAQDVDLFHGRLDGPRIARLAEAGLFSPRADDAFLACGPGDMVETARGALIERGASAERFRAELFTPDGAPPPAAASPAAAKAASQGVRVTAILDGAAHEFTYGEADRSIVDAAQSQGTELPYSCKGGMCCTCRARIVEGSAEMARNYSLEPWEIEAGFTLSCQARPTSPNLTLDYDAV